MDTREQGLDNLRQKAREFLEAHKAYRKELDALDTHIEDRMGYLDRMAEIAQADQEGEYVVYTVVVINGVSERVYRRSGSTTRKLWLASRFSSYEEAEEEASRLKDGTWNVQLYVKDVW